MITSAYEAILKKAHSEYIVNSSNEYKTANVQVYAYMFINGVKLLNDFNFEELPYLYLFFIYEANRNITQ